MCKVHLWRAHAQHCSRILASQASLHDEKGKYATAKPSSVPTQKSSVPKSRTVMKFGGSSLAGATHLRRVVAIVETQLHLQPVLVLSAMGKTTNNLLAAAELALHEGIVDVPTVRSFHEEVLTDFGIPVPEQISVLFEELTRTLSGIAMVQEISNRTQDLIISFGERLSVRVFAAVFNHLQACHFTRDSAALCIEAQPLDSWEVGFVTSSGAGSANSCFSEVEVLEDTYKGVAAYLAPLSCSHLPVVTGYIAKDVNGIITTLGRDGSDLTATIIGAAIQATEVQIWKDVSGILTADPRIIPSARPVRALTYEEAAEMTTFGATVVHPAAVMPAWQAKIPISVRNSMEPDQPGTRVVVKLGPDEARESRVAAMSSKRNITMLTIRSTRMLGQHGFLARVFQIFDKLEVSVDVIATSEVTVSLTVDQSYKGIDLDQLQKDLESVATVDIKEHRSMLTLITSRPDSGSVMRDTFQVFESLGVTVEMVSHGASNVNVTFVVSDESLMACSQKLHKVFFEHFKSATKHLPALAGA